MEVILTHEQADFDALAAQLGAYLLKEHAIPVLPRRLNRNVKAFLDLYGIELPFIEAKKLTGEQIDTITLVDTQSMTSLKGVSKNVKVCVIDHHPLRKGLPENWDIKIERLGATTTLFIEQLIESNGHLNVIHATLLLLGIYEDTGSLTYQSTTPRDLRAAAYLLEHGANLTIANNYLNPPLSQDQHRLYNNLLDSAETHTIHGQKVIICRGDACDMDEEISSVAHKLRDLLDPEGLILIVRTKEGTRMICRSTTNQVNVASIASHFGGGGHERASAALIRPETGGSVKEQDAKAQGEKIYRELKKILPQYISPQITVKQIMSYSPMTLSPDTPVEEAAKLMQRYGYEGYPVVENKRVIGLLNRRAVDRALSHNLNITTGSLMEAGEVYVRRSDSLEQLQRIMTSTGWGQVPVINPKTKDIIGIVTRTDLLKTMIGDRSRISKQQNLAIHLEEALPKARLALLKKIAEKAHNQSMAVYIVGGFVRDLLLKRPSLDFDIVVEGNAIQLARLLSSELGGRVIGHKRFGTAKWWIDDIREELAKRISTMDGFDPDDLPDSLDLISARTEFYTHPTALPTVKRGSIKLDLHRRDFTINTLALRLDGRHYGELYDYWGGVLDLQNGLVRVLHSLSFIDDPTRMLRAVRFEQRFKFQIESRTLQLIDEARPLLKQVSGQRLRHEFDLILDEDHADAMLDRLQELELLTSINPFLTWSEDLIHSIQEIAHTVPEKKWAIPPEIGGQPAKRILGYLIWLGQYPEEHIRDILRQLRFPGVMLTILQSFNRIWKETPAFAKKQPAEIVEKFENVPSIVLYAVYLLTPSKASQELIDQYITKWQHVKPYTDGNELRELGIKPGPIYKEILTTLRGAWLNGHISSEQEEKALLLSILDKFTSKSTSK